MKSIPGTGLNLIFRWLVFLAFCLLLVSCSQKEATLTFWIGGAPQEIDYWETLIGEFERTSGYDVQVVRQPTDSDQRRQGLVVSLNAQQPDPDVFLMDVVWIGQFARSGWLAPLDQYLGDGSEVSAPFFQRVVVMVDRYNDTLFALPVYVDGGLLYYRTDLLQEYNFSPPETWQDLIDAAATVQARERENNPDFNGFVWQGAQYEGLICTFLEFAASDNGGLVRDDSLTVDSPPNIEALKLMHDLIHVYRISPSNTYTEMKEEEVRRAFQRGNALFERNWPYAWKLHQENDSPVKGKIGIGPLPKFEAGRHASTLGGWHVGISRYTDVPDKAAALVRFITSFTTQKELALNLGWNPGRTDVYNDQQVLAELPHLAQLQEVFQNAVARPNLPYYTQISRVLQRYINNYLAGNGTAGEALSAANKEIDRIIGSYEEK